MILEEKLITPEIASDMLTRNRGNRPLRPRTWQAYAADMKAGKWMRTHEAIAVSASGWLINGQHRLTAIANSGISQTFWVATYDDAESAMDLPIDFGARRNLSDILGEEKIYVQTAGAVFRYAIIRHGTTARPFQMQYILEIARKQIRDAAAVSRSRERFRGSAMIRAAIVCNLLHCFDEQIYAEIIESYRAWVAGENAKWPSVEAFNKQVPSMDRNFTPNTFCRALCAFNPANLHVKIIRISHDQELQMLNGLRDSLRVILPKLFTENKDSE